MRVLLLFLGLGMLLPAAHLAAAPAAEKLPMGFSLYSDVCLNGQSTDLMGERIGILRLNRGADLYVLYQEAEGAGFLAPEDTQFITLDPSKGETIGPAIAFTIEWGGKPDTFHGRITDQVIEGEFSNPRHTNDAGGRVFRLPRVSLRQKGYPDCR